MFGPLILGELELLEASPTSSLGVEDLPTTRTFKSLTILKEKKEGMGSLTYRRKT